MTQRYHGEWKSYEDMVKDWQGSNTVKDEEVLYACYDVPGYDGYAHCVYRRDGKLFEVHDSHCSCYGLENWSPEETTEAALKLRPDAIGSLFN